MQTLKKLTYLLTPKEIRRACLLLFLILVMAFLEMVGLASILPFMAVLTNPDVVETNTYLNLAFQKSSLFGIENNQQFLFLLGILVFVLLVVSIAFKAITTYAQIRFTLMCQYSIGKRVVEGYLNESYSWFLSRHSADLGKTILSEVGTVVSNGLNPMIDLIVRSIVTITILSLLVIVDPKLAMIVFFTLGLSYGLIYKFSRAFLKILVKNVLKQINFALHQ